MGIAASAGYLLWSPGEKTVMHTPELLGGNRVSTLSVRFRVEQVARRITARIRMLTGRVQRRSLLHIKADLAQSMCSDCEIYRPHMFYLLLINNDCLAPENIDHLQHTDRCLVHY